MKTKMFYALAATAVVSMVAPQAALATEEAATSAAAIVQARAPAEAKKGAMIYSDGKRIGQVFRVRENGDAQVVINGKSHIVPAASLTEEDGKLVTSLSRAEVVASRG